VLDGLRDISPTTDCQCLKFLVPSTRRRQQPDSRVHRSSSGSNRPTNSLGGIHCQMICEIQLLTPNILCTTWSLKRLLKLLTLS